MPNWKKVIVSGSNAILNSINVTNGVTITGSLNTSGSNTFIGTQTVTGSLLTSGSNTLIGTTTLTGSLNVSGSTTQIGNNTLLGNTTLTGSIIISGSFGPSSTSSSVQIYGNTSHNGFITFNPVTANIDTSLSASYIYVSGSTNDLYFSQNGSGYNNVTRLRWIEGSLYTGLLSGGVLSTTPGSTTFNLTSGSGIIVSLNASTASADPFPTIQYVKWGNLTNQPIINSGSAKITYISMLSNGTINQQTVPIGSTDVNQWDTQIELGTILHLSGSVSTGVYNAPQTGYGLFQQTDDFLRAFGPLKISGHTLQTSGSTLGLTKTSGTAYNRGSNYVINPSHPSTVSDPAISTSKIYRYYVSGSTPIIDTGVANAGYSVIDPTLYNDNGTLTAVPGTGANKQWSIQRVFWIPNSPTNAFLVYYGNATYASSIDAQNAIQTEPFTEAPNTAQNAILIGYIIVRKDCTDLTDGTTAYITQGGLFRSVNGIGNSNTPSISNTLAGLSDVSIPGRTSGDLLYYNGSQWVNSKSLTGTYGITGSLGVTSGITADLTGTSSYALQALSSSYATTASYSTTSSYFNGSILIISQSLTTNQNVGSLSSGTQTISTNSTSSYTSAFYKYTLASGSNARAGQVMAVWNGSNIQYTDVATNDIGNTSNVALTASLSGGNVLLTTTLPSSGWTVKTLVNLL
jgi:hypothetical protein